MSHLLRIGVLLAAITALLMGAGWPSGGAESMVSVLVIAAVGNLFAYWNGEPNASGARRVA